MLEAEKGAAREETKEAIVEDPPGSQASYASK
jgi:hypothetical protein